jgi:hypothetical protein
LLYGYTFAFGYNLHWRLRAFLPLALDDCAGPHVKRILDFLFIYFLLLLIA